MNTIRKSLFACVASLLAATAAFGGDQLLSGAVTSRSGQKLEGVLPALLEKSLERGWKVVVQGSSEEHIEALDAHLWTYRDDGFLPHGTWREPEAAQQPVLFTLSESNPNGATVRFLIDGAPMPADP